MLYINVFLRTRRSAITAWLNWDRRYQKSTFPEEQAITLSVHDLAFLDYGPFTFTVDPGEAICIQGGSGSGKTLLLRALADLDHHSGQVSLGKSKQQQTPPAAWRKQIGYLPPDAIFWTETMAEYFVRFKEPAVGELLHSLELEPLLEKPMNKLSSGEKQRFGLVRLLANQPGALLLDEPTSHLDPASVTLAESAILDYQERHGCPMILVSHDNEQCRRMTRQCFSMRNKRLHAA